MKNKKEQINELTKKRYHRLAEQGLCVSCGFRKATKNTKKCCECRELTRQVNSDRRLRLISEGKCTSCANDLGNSINLLCEKCSEKNRLYSLERTKKNREKINQKRRERYKREGK